MALSIRSAVIITHFLPLFFVLWRCFPFTLSYPLDNSPELWAASIRNGPTGKPIWDLVLDTSPAARLSLFHPSKKIVIELGLLNEFYLFSWALFFSFIRVHLNFPIAYRNSSDISTPKSVLVRTWLFRRVAESMAFLPYCAVALFTLFTGTLVLLS